MPSFKLVVLTNPVAGAEDEYNDWYNNQHLQDVLAVPGFKSAQRFRLVDPMDMDHKHKYLAIYNMECDDPKEAVAELLGLSNTSSMVISEALDMSTALAGVYSVCSPLVEKP